MAEEIEESAKRSSRTPSRRTKAASSSSTVRKGTVQKKDAQDAQNADPVRGKSNSPNRIDFRADPLDLELAQGIATIKRKRKERATLSSIHQPAQRLGLLALAALTGPDPENGLYAGFLSAEQLAEWLRLDTLGLADFQQKVGRPLYPTQSPLVLASQLTPTPSPALQPTPPSEEKPLEMNTSGAKAVGGLGVGLLKKRRKPPETSLSSDDTSSPD